MSCQGDANQTTRGQRSVPASRQMVTRVGRDGETLEPSPPSLVGMQNGTAAVEHSLALS